MTMDFYDAQFYQDTEVEVKTHQCCCTVAGERCINKVKGSDNPFCANCEDRHPDYKRLVNMEVGQEF